MLDLPISYGTKMANQKFVTIALLHLPQELEKLDSGLPQKLE